MEKARKTKTWFVVMLVDLHYYGVCVSDSPMPPNLSCLRIPSFGRLRMA